MRHVAVLQVTLTFNTEEDQDLNEIDWKEELYFASAVKPENVHVELTEVLE